MTPSDEHIAKILLETRTIAMVGASIKPERPSHRVGNYLTSVGYRVVPVNPGHAGKVLFGQEVRATLADIDIAVDLLNIFRRSDQVLPMVEQGLAALPGLKTVWMQQGIENAEARALAEAEGLAVLEDACIAVEHRRLLAGRAGA